MVFAMSMNEKHQLVDKHQTIYPQKEPFHGILHKLKLKKYLFEDYDVVFCLKSLFFSLSLSGFELTGKIAS